MHSFCFYSFPFVGDEILMHVLVGLHANYSLMFIPNIRLSSAFTFGEKAKNKLSVGRREFLKDKHTLHVLLSGAFSFPLFIPFLVLLHVRDEILHATGLPVKDCIFFVHASYYFSLHVKIQPFITVSVFR
jgi:hypothetical protein